jgi:hypothetical protein
VAIDEIDLIGEERVLDARSKRCANRIVFRELEARGETRLEESRLGRFFIDCERTRTEIFDRVSEIDVRLFKSATDFGAKIFSDVELVRKIRGVFGTEIWGRRLVEGRDARDTFGEKTT